MSGPVDDECMCGRFTLTKPARLVADLFRLPEPPPEMAPRYNIAPSQKVPVVGLKPDGHTRGLAHLRWGLVPSWANSMAEGIKPINARAEGIESKPAFRGKRCLLVMDGYYEWAAVGGKKVPHHIRFADGRPFGVAGLWDVWTDGTAKLVTCCMVTTAANADVRGVHDRMPVILDPDRFDRWLSPDADEKELKALLVPYRAGELAAVRVGPKVGNARYDGPECLAPAA